jgi:NitT/TauT family transport system substrate-binding protein
MRAVLLDRRHREHGDPRSAKFLRRQVQPVGHMSLRQHLANVMSFAYGPRNSASPRSSHEEFRMTPAPLTRRALIALMLLAAPAQAQPLDKVSFGTNWVAEAEHGGFYQAVADGTYRKYGLDVTIVPGGPQVNNRIPLLAGKIDFFMSANSLQGFDAVAQNIPTVAVAAMFQKDPQVLLAHPGEGIEKFEDLKKTTLLVSAEGLQSYFKWMQAEFGFSQDKVKPYTFNPQPFLVDKQSAMQGYVTSEPYAIKKADRFKPVIFLHADHDFNTYSTLIEARRETV